MIVVDNYLLSFIIYDIILSLRNPYIIPTKYFCYIYNIIITLILPPFTVSIYKNILSIPRITNCASITYMIKFIQLVYSNPIVKLDLSAPPLRILIDWHQVMGGK